MCWACILSVLRPLAVNSDHNVLFAPAQAKHILSSVQEFAAAQDSSELGNEEISYLARENKSLQNRLAEHQQQYTTTLNEVTSELSNTRREMVSGAPCPFLCSWDRKMELVYGPSCSPLSPLSLL